MNRLSEPEIFTQKRLIDLLCETMNYDYLGEWKERENNTRGTTGGQSPTRYKENG